MVKRKQWDEAKVRAEAVKYQRKVDFKRAEYGAYQAMCRRFPHLIEELFDDRPSKYTPDIIKAIAQRYPDRKAFERAERGAHSAQVNFFPGILDEIFPLKIKPANYWTFDRLKEEAANFKTKEDFYRGALGAYSAAVRNGWLDELGFESAGTMDNNTVYIWKAVGVFFNGNQVYKIGVSSARIGHSRIRRVSQRSGIKAEVVCCVEVTCKATQIEKQLLTLGSDPKLTGFVGCTEFRALNDVELAKTIRA